MLILERYFAPVYLLLELVAYVFSDFILFYLFTQILIGICFGLSKLPKVAHCAPTSDFFGDALLGNLDEKVNDRVLYEILIQAGRLVDIYIPRDKETNRPKGFAFAEFETEEIADYAVRLFSGLVTLYNRTLKFAVRLCLVILVFLLMWESWICPILLINFLGNFQNYSRVLAALFWVFGTS